MNRSEKVFLGPWTDYEKGAVLGWSLTLTSRQGFMVLAVIAISIQLTGQRSWKIIKFVIHQLRKHHVARNAMIKEQESAPCRNRLGNLSANGLVALELATLWATVTRSTVEGCLARVQAIHMEDINWFFGAFLGVYDTGHRCPRYHGQSRESSSVSQQQRLRGVELRSLECE